MYSSKLSAKQEEQLKILKKDLIAQIQDKQPDNWLKINKTMLRILEIVPELPYLLVSDIKWAIEKVNNLLALLVLYSQDISDLRRSNHFREQFITIKKKEKSYQNITKWISEQPEQTRDKAIQIIVQNLPTFFEKEMRFISYQDFSLLLTFFNRYQLKSDKEINVLMNFTAKLQKIELSVNGNLGLKELAIMKIICQILQKEEGCGNLGILFDETLIGSSSSKNIDQFCNLESGYILKLKAEKLQKIFKQLCRIGINYMILQFIYSISRLLANQEQFYKLAYLYEKVILPIVALRAKTCRKPKVQLLALKITEFYFYGFFTFYHKLQKSALQCLLKNIQHIKTKEIQARWLLLCDKTIDNNPSLKAFIEQQLVSKGLPKLQVSLRAAQNLMQQYQIWKITPRNIRQLKQYNYEPSELKGIINYSCQCYIISIVQALFMTKSLSRIIQKVKPRMIGHRAVDCLNAIFDKLQSSSKILPSVEDLKAFGPKYFEKSQRQEDAQNYLIYLMEQLQEQFKKQGLLQQFKKLFEMRTKDTISCRNCEDHKKVVQYSQYVHTFAHGEKFVLQRSEELLDYKCDKCNKKQCKKTTTISLTGDIAILHINRFSSEKGASKKQLPTQQIKRKINDHQLVGMVFHIGKNMQSGHYIYFSRVGKKRWAQMNDKEVTQFNLDFQDEEFQKEFKQQKTPYILFYKKSRQSK